MKTILKNGLELLLGVLILELALSYWEKKQGKVYRERDFMRAVLGQNPQKGRQSMLIKELPREAKESQISDPQTLYKILKSIFTAEDRIDQDKEHFWAIGLNMRNRIKYIELVSLGSLNAAVVTPREVFRRAIIEGVASLMVAHNHPSGDYTPSMEDNASTRTLVQSGKILQIPVIEHLIFSTEGYYSMREHGALDVSNPI